MPRLLSSDTPLVPTAAGYDRLTGTTASDATSTALATGKFATLKVGSQAVNVRWGSSAPTAIGTDIEYQAGDTVHWYVEPDTTFVAAISSDATTAYEVWVWQSS